MIHNYLIERPQENSTLFKIILVFFLICILNPDKLSAQIVNIEPGFSTGQSVIEREGFSFSGSLFEAGIGFEFFKNNNESFTYSLGVAINAGQLNFDDLQPNDLQRFSLDFVRLPVFLNLTRSFYKESDSAIFSVILSAGLFYKIVYNTEIFNGEEVFEGENEGAFGFTGKFGIKIHLSKRIYTIISLNVASDFSSLNLSEENDFRITNERSFGLTFGFSF